MKLVIQGKNIDITDAIRQHVSQKIEKAVSHFQHLINKVDVCLSVAGGNKSPSRQCAEVTVYVNRAVVRAEEVSDSLYASIDLVADKISRQLRKYKEKRQSSDHSSVRSMSIETELIPDADWEVASVLETREPELPTEVVRAKYFAMAPMSVQEALENLQLVDHDFYVFHNLETNSINVIYERNHGGYGLIQPRHVSRNGAASKAALNGHHGERNSASSYHVSAG